MGFFKSLFGGDKICDFCGNEVGIFGNNKLSDGNMCDTCHKKVSPWITNLKEMTIESMNDHLAYREDNQGAVDSFQTSRVFGSDEMKLYIDDENRWLLFSKDKNWNESNPDVLSFDQITGVSIKIEKEEHQRAMSTDTEMFGAQDQMGGMDRMGGPGMPPPPNGQMNRAQRSTERPPQPPRDNAQNRAQRPPQPSAAQNRAQRPPQPDNTQNRAQRPPQPSAAQNRAQRPPQPDNTQNRAQRPPQPSAAQNRAQRPTQPNAAQNRAQRPTQPNAAQNRTERVTRTTGSAQRPENNQTRRAPEQDRSNRRGPSRPMAINNGNPMVIASPIYYTYDFYLIVYVNSDWFSEIKFKLNDDSIEDDSSTEYTSMNQIAESMRDALQAIIDNKAESQETAQAPTAPKQAVNCPYCGATTIPDDNGCCEYCGSHIDEA